MRIVYEPTSRDKFGNLKAGRVFSYNGTIYMKTDECCDNDVFSVSLEDGSLVVIPNEEIVSLVNCSLVIK